MSRTLPVKFSKLHEISFTTNNCRHHVYKSVWTPKNGEKLDCHIHDCHAASMYDNHAIGVYKQEKYSTLVGHVTIECSTLLNFLNADKENRLTANWSTKNESLVW